MKENIYIHIYIYVCIIEFLCCIAEMNIKSAIHQLKKKKMCRARLCGVGIGALQGCQGAGLLELLC